MKPFGKTWLYDFKPELVSKIEMQSKIVERPHRFNSMEKEKLFFASNLGNSSLKFDTLTDCFEKA